jgi:hypothetical protein
MFPVHAASNVGQQIMLKKYFLKLFDWSVDNELYYHLSQNPNITWEQVNANDFKPWSYHALSRNINITGDIVAQNLDKEWDFNFLSRNPTIKWELITSVAVNKWDFSFLSMNPNITIDHVLSNPHLPWDYEYLIDNPNITIEIILDNPQLPWHYRALSMSPKVNFHLVNTTRHLPWCFAALSANPNLRFQDVRNNPNEKWDWACLSATLPDLEFEIYRSSEKEKFISLIDFYHYSRNDITTWIKSYFIQNKEFDFFAIATKSKEVTNIITDCQNRKFKKKYTREVSKNPNLPLSLLIQEQKEYDWRIISSRMDVTSQLVKYNRHLDWSKTEIMMNPNIDIFELFVLEDKPCNRELLRIFPKLAQDERGKIKLENRNELKPISKNPFHFYGNKFFLVKTSWDSNIW